MYSTFGDVSREVFRKGERTAYLGQLAHGIQHLRAQLGGEALEVLGAVDVLGLRRLELLDGVLERGLGRAGLELDDVVARDELGGSGLDDGRREGQREESGPSEELHGDVGQVDDERDCVLASAF
jgi:hypothetical protein